MPDNETTVQPLADRLRPRSFEEFFGQEDLIGRGKLLRRLIESDQVPSLILWGPPGVGKTTLARLIAEATDAFFVALSAVKSGKAELMSTVEEAEERLTAKKQKTILFVDEIHRWNKAQQDALLPYVEQGIVTLIGATTENPSFEIIGALLSRSRVFVLKKLSTNEIRQILGRALQDKERGLGKLQMPIDDAALDYLAEIAGGDARMALNTLEILVSMHDERVRDEPHPGPLLIGEGNFASLTIDHIREALQRTHVVFDRKGEEFYNTISALHKSMRGSDPNAALYWLARMLEGGADPLYIARRVVRFASEDIGMANSEALVQAIAAYEACHYLGMPECTVHLAQAVIYCAKSKKSNLLYTAYAAAAEDARATSHLGVPLHIRNAPTKLMKDLDYGKEYKYNPDFVGEVKQEYLPDDLIGRDYFSGESMKKNE